MLWSLISFLERKPNYRFTGVLDWLDYSLSNRWGFSSIQLNMSWRAQFDPVSPRSTITVEPYGLQLVTSTGNALAQVQRMHEPADLWDTTFCINFEASSTKCTRWFWDPELSRMHLQPQIQIPSAFPVRDASKSACLSWDFYGIS